MNQQIAQQHAPYMHSQPASRADYEMQYSNRGTEGCQSSLLMCGYPTGRGCGLQGEGQDSVANQEVQVELRKCDAERRVEHNEYSLKSRTNA